MVRNITRSFFFGLLAAATALTPLPAAATTLLDVGGTQDTGLTIDAGTAAAVSFTLDHTANDVTIDASILCLGCVGGIWFQRTAIGSTASFGDALGGEAFSSATPTPYFTFSSLDPGLYFFIVSVDSNSLGSAIWSGSTTPMIHSDGAARGLDFQAATTFPFVPLSNFQVVFGKNLNFVVTAADQTTVVPEPATWVLMIAGFALVGCAARCQFTSKVQTLRRDSAQR